MQSLILSCFFAILVVAYVECQQEECGVLKIKCRQNQYCYRPKIPNVEIDLGICLRYLRKGAICTDELLCEPSLECLDIKSGFLKLRTCQEPSSTTATSEPTQQTLSTEIPTEPTGIPTVSTEIPTVPTDIPTVSTEIPTDIPTVSTEIPTDIPTVSTDGTPPQ